MKFIDKAAEFIFTIFVFAATFIVPTFFGYYFKSSLIGWIIFLLIVASEYINFENGKHKRKDPEPQKSTMKL